MSRNLRHKRRAKRCGKLAAKAIRNNGIDIWAWDEDDAYHLAKGGCYLLKNQEYGWGMILKPR